MASTATKKKFEIHDEAFGSLPFDLRMSRIKLKNAIARGGYTYFDKSIPGHFSYLPRRVRHLKAHLLNFGVFVDAMPHMGGLRAATLEELLAFGIQYPNVQRHFPIVALGTEKRIGQSPGVWNVPYLSGDMKSRRLCLGASRFGWSDVFRFLVVET